jgi:DNA-binding IclR family transcriptional regulator
VLDDEGLPAAVLSLCGPASRLVEQAETLAPLLLEASHRLSVRIGGPAAQPPSTAVRS